MREKEGKRERGGRGAAENAGLPGERRPNEKQPGI